MQVPTLEETDWKGKRVLLRVDFNVPLDGGKVTDDARIVAALPTIQHLREKGARLILMSHLGRPKGQRVPELSLRPVAAHMHDVLGVPTRFAPDCIGEAAEAAAAALAPGEVLLLENLRFHPGETANDPAFAAGLARLADHFVNDAFGTAHRAHASTVGVTEHLPASAGFLIEKELRLLGTALDDPAHPFTAILGGAKVSDKILLIERLLPKVDCILIGGGMAFTFLKAQGHDVGKSLVDTERLELAGRLMGRASEHDVEIILPEDVEEAERFDARAQHRAVKVDHMDPEWMGLDIGPRTMKTFAKHIRESGTVLWNGPMGVFEWDPFQFGTKAVAQAVARCKGTTIIGGGDSAAAAKRFGIVEKVSHVSTGGGASLKFLEGETLPGIAALQRARVAAH